VFPWGSKSFLDLNLELSATVLEHQGTLDFVCAVFVLSCEFSMNFLGILDSKKKMR
jgi:hypothetical protein